jgi:hypothetical protein
MVILTGACLFGCASTPTRLSEPLGPRPGAPLNANNSGALQVYTAQERILEDMKLEEFFVGEAFRKQLFEPAHTDYDLLTQDGRVLQRVKNARDSQDPEPALLPLPPGRYQVKALCQETSDSRVTVFASVVIETGKTTRVHLEPHWMPHGPFAEPAVVRLPKGGLVGWRAVSSEISNP